MRDALTELAAAAPAALGISPDAPAIQKRFAAKHDLGYALLSDPDHVIAEAYGVWGEKKMYGKIFMGIVRSAFLVDDKGLIRQAWYRISPKNTGPELVKAIAN